MIDLKKIIIGSSNFYTSYGYERKLVNQIDVKKILNFSKRNKINNIDISTNYLSDSKIYRNFDFANWKFSFKITKEKNRNFDNEKILRHYIDLKLKNINNTKIDYFLFHYSDDLLSTWGKKVFKILSKLKLEGKIDKIGVSIYDPAELKEIIINFKIDVVQAPFNILDQRFCDSKLSSQLKSKKIEVHARSIFLQGVLLNKSGKFSGSKELLKYKRFLNKQKIKPINSCLDFVLNNKNIDKVIIGVKSKDELDEIINIKLKNNYKFYNSLKTENKDIIDPRRWSKNKVLCIVQARMTSERFPGKVLKYIDKKRSVLQFLIERLNKSKLIDQLVISCSDNAKDKKIIDFCKKNKIDYFAGSENNLLDRYYKTYKKFDGDTIVRITSDCPFIDATLLDKMIKKFFEKKADYLSNTIIRTFPDGLDIEIFKSTTLEFAKKNVTSLYDQEHVTPFMKRSKKINSYNFKNKKDFSDVRVTLDYRDDLADLRKIVRKFNSNTDFTLKNLINLKKKYKDNFIINMNKKNKKFLKKNSGQKLWEKAKNIIPGGNMLLSKKPELFLPNGWPTYFSKTKGCKVWDLDKKMFFDVSLMGVGTNILGYSNNKVDDAVKKVVRQGNMSSLNCSEEVVLAEKLIKIHPWADMVKFARTGGEANAIAVRIARATSGKDNVAFCGYHGWQDWYLATNLRNNQNLNKHLLKGILTKGVPLDLKGSIFPFEYNNFSELENLVNKKNIGVICMEVMRNKYPKNNFLHKVRKLANKKGIVLIFDECTSAFRKNFGGLHLNFKVNPDIAVFGKALGNGYAITAVIGKKEFMKNAQKSFISSTFWTERIGPAAAIATLDTMSKIKSWKIINRNGKFISENWKKLAEKYGLEIEINGLPALSSFAIKSKNFRKYKALITQEMLKKGFLASNSVYSCISHSKTILDEYFWEMDKVFKLIQQCENGQNIDKLLAYPVPEEKFKRVN